MFTSGQKEFLGGATLTPTRSSDDPKISAPLRPSARGTIGNTNCRGDIRMPEASIFLVEDEALIRMMLADMIEELGHRVVAEAANVQDGIALAEAAIFDLAILDINLGGASIAPVAEIIDRRGLPLLFVSGYGPDGRPETFRDRPALQKPLSISVLGAAIDAILASSGEASSPKTT
jgi:DNA-binding response OmpR family regulator